VRDSLVLDTEAGRENDATPHGVAYCRDALGQIEIVAVLWHKIRTDGRLSCAREDDAHSALKSFGGVHWCPRSARRGRLEKAPALSNQQEK
jgi:hypothetical protein